MSEWKKFENKPSIELVELIKMGNEDAFNAFYFRFAPEINKKCEIICHNWKLDQVFASELSAETFKRFWKYPKFDPAKSTSKDLEKGIILYLLGIAQRVKFDLSSKKYSKKASPYDGSEEIVWNFPAPKEEDCGEIEDIQSHYTIVKKALDTLSPKHKVIYLTYMKYEESGFKLPRKLLEDLRQELKLSQQTVRSYKNEAVNKIKEYFQIYENK